jgi:formamidopyrimidine-DNA glycosylase
VDPPIREAEGRTVDDLRRLGKRIVLGLSGDLFLVLHLMVAGRLRWRSAGAELPGRIGLAAFDFTSGALILTEAGKKKRASLHLVQGEVALRPHDPGGLEVLDADLPAFRQALTRENRTLKRALTDPRLLSGIGNAYSDEILFRARLSPARLTRRLDDEALERLFHAVRETLQEWTERLRHEVGDGFPEKVTAFHKGMAVSANRARNAARRSSGSSTRRTSRTTAPAARPAESSCGIAPCPSCSGTTGPARWTSSRRVDCDSGLPSG